jgi:hypothetical protein
MARRKIHRGKSNKRISSNIDALMKLGYSYSQAVRASKTLAGKLPNPIDTRNALIGLLVAGAAGVAIYYLMKPATSTTITTTSPLPGSSVAPPQNGP